MDSTRTTSREAYESILESLPRMRQKVFEIIFDQGIVGHTCDEIERVLGGRHQSISARVTELHQAGHIVDNGERRRTRSGRSAVVWVAKAWA